MMLSLALLPLLPIISLIILVLVLIATNPFHVGAEIPVRVRR